MRKMRVRNLLVLLLAALALQGTAEAKLPAVGDLQLPSELADAVDGVEELMDPEAGGDFGLASGAAALWNRAVEEVRDDLLTGMRSVTALLAGILLLGVAEQAAGGKKAVQGRPVLLIGTAYVTSVSAGQLDGLIGLGRETITRMTELSTLLLPSLAAAAAASGNITAASLRQVAAVWFSNLLLTAIDRLFIPMVYLYIGIAAADTILEGGALGSIGDLLKKGIMGLDDPPGAFYSLFDGGRIRIRRGGRRSGADGKNCCIGGGTGGGKHSGKSGGECSGGCGNAQGTSGSVWDACDPVGLPGAVPSSGCAVPPLSGGGCSCGNRRAVEAGEADEAAGRCVHAGAGNDGILGNAASDIRYFLL